MPNFGTAVRVVVFEHFIPDGRREFQGIGARDVESRAEERDRSFRIERPVFSARLRAGAWRIADNVAVHAQLIDILGQLLLAELAAESEADATSRELEQLGRIDVQIEGSQLRRIDVFRMNGGEVGRAELAANRGPSASPKGLKALSPARTPPGGRWDRSGSEFRLKREVEISVTRDGLHIAVTESEIVTPCSIKQFVAPGSRASRGTNRFGCRRGGCRIRGDEPGWHPR